MPIQTSCPSCQTPYNLSDRQRGKRVRCRQCADTFVVGGGDAAAILDVEPVEDDEPAPRVVNRPRPAAARRPRVRDEDDDYRSGEDSRRGGVSPLVWVGAGAGALVLLAAVGGVTWWALSGDDSPKGDTPAAAVAQAAPRPKEPEVPAAPAVPAFNPIGFAPNASGPAAGAPAFVPSAPARRDPFAQPKDVSDAIDFLKDAGDAGRRKRGAEWLGRTPVDQARRQEVAAALEPVLSDGDLFTRQAAARAMVTWATKDNVPALLKAVEWEAGSIIDPAVDALAATKDERAPAALAKLLPNFFRRQAAVRGLTVLGPMAEKQVLPYLHHKDLGVRADVERLLRGYGTGSDAILTQSIADLKAVEGETRHLAAEWLSKAKVDANRQKEVALGLDPLLTDGHAPARASAVKALVGWATADNVPSLLRLLQSDRRNIGNRDRALEILGNIRDERATAPVAALLTDFFSRGPASQCLIAMGPVAEKEVIPYLTSADGGVRREACKILGEIGTRKSLQPLDQAGRRDRGMTTDVRLAAQKILMRK
jgi:predicted Zn finger-like uncharacterized protein